MKELCLLLVWISSVVIAVTLTARQLHAERESRTLFSLLSKPVSRNELIFGKFFGCWLACGVALLVFYAFFISPPFRAGRRLAVAGVFPGVLAALDHARRHRGDGAGRLAGFHRAVVQHHNQPRHYRRHPHAGPASWQTCRSHATSQCRRLALAIFYAMPHLEFYDLRDLIIHDWPPVKWSAVGLVTLYGAVYAGISSALRASCSAANRSTLDSHAKSHPPRSFPRHHRRGHFAG